MGMVFKAGDAVAWSHSFSTLHAAGSIVKKEAVKASDPNAKFGSIVGAANEHGSEWCVSLEDNSVVVLTSDELVQVS